MPSLELWIPFYDAINFTLNFAFVKVLNRFKQCSGNVIQKASDSEIFHLNNATTVILTSAHQSQ